MTPQTRRRRFALALTPLATVAVMAMTPSSAFAQEGTTPSPTASPPSGNGSASTPRQQSDRPATSEGEKKDTEHFRIGPLLGIGFPRPLEIEGMVKLEKLVGIGLEYSLMPKMNIMGAEATFKGIAADLRIFPFKGAFFIGAKAGRQWLDARTTVTVGQIGSFQESMSANTWFVNPRIGFLKTWDSGITVGIDAGVQLPINATYQRSGPATDAGLISQTNIDQTLASVAGALGNNTTPTIDLLRVGFLF